MPIYEYRCQSCAHELEALQKLSDQLLTDCPSCGQAALKKKISAAGFRLKGGGWYETDFKSKNQKNLAGERKDASKAENKPSEGKTSDNKTGDKNASTGSGKSRTNAAS